MMRRAHPTGVAGLFECELWERILLLLRPPSAFPAEKSYCQVPWWKMHLFTLLQILCLAVAWGVNLSPAGLLFSVIIVLLVPFRALVVPRPVVRTTSRRPAAHRQHATHPHATRSHRMLCCFASFGGGRNRSQGCGLQSIF